MNKIIIDAGGVVYGGIHPPKLINSITGNPELDDQGRYIYQSQTVKDVYSHIDSILMNIFKNTNSTEYIGFVDTNPNMNFRLITCPCYKQNRVGKPINDFVYEAKQYLIDVWKFNPVDTIEADDAVLITRNHYGPFTIIASVDKDITHLEGTIYNFGRKQGLVVNSSKDEEDFFWRQMIIGDTADNLRGIPGMGEKGADKLLNGVLIPEYKIVVLNKYIEKFGEYNGIDEFYRSYKCLKILTDSSQLPEGYTFNIPNFNVVP